MDLGLVGRVAVAAIELRGRCLIAGLLRTAVRESTASSLSVDVVQRQPPAAPTTRFLFLRIAVRGGGDAVGGGPLGGGAGGRRGEGAVAAIELRGPCLIAGLLRTAVRALRRPLYPLTWCSGSRPRRRQQVLFYELPAAMQLEDGPRAGGASGRGGDRATGSMLDRRAVAH